MEGPAYLDNTQTLKYTFTPTQKYGSVGAIGVGLGCEPIAGREKAKAEPERNIPTSSPVNMHPVITFYERGCCNEDDEHVGYSLEAIGGRSSQRWKAIKKETMMLSCKGLRT